MSNPCGLSQTDALKIIRDVVEGNPSLATKKDVVNSLIINGKLSPKEANDVANFYYSEYKKLLKQNLKTELPINDRALKKSAQKYLTLESDAPLLTEKEIEEYIKPQYARAKRYRENGLIDKASTIESDVATYLLSKMPDEASIKLFENFIYAKPLISGRFFFSTSLSNLFVNFNRVIASVFTTKAGIDLRPLKMMVGSRFGLLKAKSVFSGGLAASDIHSQESGDLTTSRPELLDQKGIVNKLYAWTVRFGKRLINPQDTFGIVTATDLHYRTIVVNNKYDELRLGGMSKSDARKQSRLMGDRAMQLMKVNEAKDIADKVFSDDGITVDDKFKNTTEYKIAVEEIMRSHRNEDILQAAFQRSAEDYFKARMTERSEFGIFNDGLMGAFARVAGGIKKTLSEKAQKNAKEGNIKMAKFQQASGLGIFGFVNGMSAFGERVLEAVPIYGLSKLALMNLDKKGKNSEVRNAIAQKQRDLMVNMTTAFMMYAILRGIKALAEDNCDKLKVPESNIYGKYRTTICGKQVMPFIIPAQLEVVFGFYNWLFDTGLAEKQDNITQDAVGAITVILSNARMGQDQPSTKMINNFMEGLSQKKKGNDIASQEYYNRGVNEGIGIVLNFGNSFLPIPTRPVQEAGSYLQPTQKQTRPVFDIKNPNSAISTIANAAKLKTGEIIGLSNFITFFGDTPKPLLDWQSREVMNTRAGYWAGEGIKYDKYDDLFAQAKVPLPYLSPYTEVLINETKTGSYKSPLTSKVVEQFDVKKRYLPEDEFFTLQKAVGEFNKEFFKKNYDEYKGYDKEKLKDELIRYNKRIKTYAFKAVEGTKVKTEKEIISFLTDKIKSKRALKQSEAEIDSELLNYQ